MPDPTCLAFDVYGTLVDPSRISEALRTRVGEDADAFAAAWREKQLEYAFRRALMRRYEDFTVCTRQALEFTDQRFGRRLGPAGQDQTMTAYLRLPAFADAAPALERLQAAGHRLVAFSNGSPDGLETVLQHAGLRERFEALVSVDEVRTYKPDPAAYARLVERVARPPAGVWLVSSNPFDVIGARAAGLRAAWVRRRPDQAFDPWGIEPDLTVSGLDALADQIAVVASAPTDLDVGTAGPSSPDPAGSLR